ncbi:hypothetical protein LIPSTDRAFT_329300 [Lipomyces starkeyi NRRL Y-11557]|uniref:Uncharacterized protein n=1 Tax=Lipomyces starkeyi NRRL Y-11557 TaxID=675824 RepID=A0A1E3Q2B1_LIPST|nr:hypothetical protein LIPSTDRAFT_329300 [Lipomyces starkeyi NRRL Y-11557]
MSYLCHFCSSSASRASIVLKALVLSLPLFLLLSEARSLVTTVLVPHIAPLATALDSFLFADFPRLATRHISLLGDIRH